MCAKDRERSSARSVWIHGPWNACSDSGLLSTWLQNGVDGLLYDLKVLDSAIRGGSAHDDTLNTLQREGATEQQALVAILQEEIRSISKLLLERWEESRGEAGILCVPMDTRGIMETALKGTGMAEHPNVLLLAPPSLEGLAAAAERIREGAGVVVGPVVTEDQLNAAAQSMEQQLRGSGSQSDPPLQRPISKAFIAFQVPLNLIDRNPLTQKANGGSGDTPPDLAISCVKALNQKIRRLSSTDPWKRLLRDGLAVARIILTDTSPPMLHLPDTYYPSLIAEDGVIWALPWESLWMAPIIRGQRRPLESGRVGPEADKAQNWASQRMEVDINEVGSQVIRTQRDRIDGQIQGLLDSIRYRWAGMRNWPLAWTGKLGAGEGPVRETFDRAVNQRVPHRIWTRDHTLWKDSPQEITNRLGWLRSPNAMERFLDELHQFAERVKDLGFSNGYLLGMGGSSLAPELFTKAFGVKTGAPAMGVLDTTDPSTIKKATEGLDLANSLFIVSTKSGTTVETLSLFKHFYNLILMDAGRKGAGEHFVAITDPKGPLSTQAKERSFLRVFLNDPEIGGRYSALSYFGMVMAALIGVDVGQLLKNARVMWANCHPCNCGTKVDNAGLWLGCALGELAEMGRDKLTLHASDCLAPLLPWIEQLIAESTGKEGKGILPVIGEQRMQVDAYGPDRVFVVMRTAGENRFDQWSEGLASKGHPIIHLEIADLYSIGGEFFRWEIATATAAWRMGINPFDQPNVEAAKVRAKQALKEAMKGGRIPDPPSVLQDGCITAFCHPHEICRGRSGVTGLIKGLLERAQVPGSYVSIQAFLPPGPEIEGLLEELRKWIGLRRPLPTTVGFGPRFLHSSGQLHKGDSGKGLFIQLTYDPPVDIPIPEEAGSTRSSITFGQLLRAQAYGDYRALQERGRNILRLHLKDDPAEGLRRLLQDLNNWEETA